MIESEYYNESIRKYVMAFGSILNGIIVDDKPVPLLFSTKEKFITKHIYSGGVDSDGLDQVKELLPAMGYELNTLVYDASRKTNTFSTIAHGESFMYNRVPYNFGFSVTLATRMLDTSLRIVEQIVPHFTPSITVMINDHAMIDESSEVVITMDSIRPEIDAMGDMTERRGTMWMMDFTVRGFLYRNEVVSKRIKKNIIDIYNKGTNNFMSNIFQYVDPTDDTIINTEYYYDTNHITPVYSTHNSTLTTTLT